MKKNKIIIAIFAIFGTILIGLGTFSILKETPISGSETKNEELLDKIITNFNDRDLAIYLNENRQEIRAKKIDKNTMEIFYKFGGNENHLPLHLENGIISSDHYLEESIAQEFIDIVLKLTDENATFLAPFKTNTFSDYNLEEDGIEIEQKPKENIYKIKIQLDKEIPIKDLNVTTITPKDYENEGIRLTWNEQTYYQKGYIIYKEEIDNNGNKVVTFAQLAETKENMRQSIANYIETYHSKELKEDFLNNNSLETIKNTSPFTKDNYTLEKDYLVFSSTEKDPYFDDYLYDYKVTVLVLKNKQ